MKPSFKIQWQDFKFKLAQFLGIAPLCDDSGNDITPPWVLREQASIEQLGYTHGVQAARGQRWEYLAWYRENHVSINEIGHYMRGFQSGVLRVATGRR